MFQTKYGNPWYREDQEKCPISHEFRKLCKTLKIYKPGITQFYSLRRTFQTIGDQTGELLAVRYMMGHIPPTSDMSSIYHQGQRVADAALLRVSEHVRQWVLGKQAK